MNAAANRRRGFTLIEAVVSTTIAALAGAALLQGIYSSIGSTRSAQQQTIAAGMAQQMMDEIAGKTYSATRNVTETSLSASAVELAGPGRSLFNDIDDFNGVRNGPVKDPWNVNVGDDDGKGGSRHPSMRVASTLNKYRREVDVYYVSNSDLKTKLAAGQTSDFKMVEVRVYIDDPNGARRLLTTLKRAFAYVPTL